jgi:hypothetical protein
MFNCLLKLRFQSYSLIESAGILINGVCSTDKEYCIKQLYHLVRTQNHPCPSITIRSYIAHKLRIYSAMHTACL